ncbi:MAG TPA: hypothetical protein VMU83_11290 [Hanamia sp.]|nr:hypothetical protein [Hanamia sp.]
MSASETLPSLLATVLGRLEQIFIDEGGGGKEMPSLDLWANLLRVLDDVGTDSHALPMMVSLSKRALQLRMKAAMRHGWVEVQKSGSCPATVKLTVRGSAATTRCKRLIGEVEELWRANTGADLAHKFRTSLESAVAGFQLELPHYPASYGATDASITGGNGRDWKAVRRRAGDTVSKLPLTALVSQALVAFAMRYEEKSPVALSLSTTVIRYIPPGGCPLQDLGNSVGVSALLRHGFLRLSGTGANGTLSLTSKGLAVKSAYEERIRSVEADWRKDFGDISVTNLRRDLADVIDTTRA